MKRATAKPEDWIEVRPEGLYVVPGDFYVDPARPAARAVISHGHADHARPNNDAVLATPETIAIMQARYRDHAGGSFQALAYGETQSVNGVDVTLVPAGHVLGSAQVVLDWKGSRIVVSGDYKRRADATCTAFEPVRGADVFITEATFGLPVFRHPDDGGEVAKLLASLELFPERCHLTGAYGLGKAQRLIRLIRDAGYARPIWLHGALVALCELYQAHGVALGDLRPVAGKDRKELAGEIVLAPPSATRDVWSRRMPDPVVGMASGWMQVRQRAKQRGAELPLIISDHADWDELVRTIEEVNAPEIWVTHGAEEALVHQARKLGFEARALSLVGRGDEDETPEPEPEPEQKPEEAGQ